MRVGGTENDLAKFHDNFTSNSLLAKVSPAELFLAAELLVLPTPPLNMLPFTT